LKAKQTNFRGQSKQDEALDCYGRAANLFKMAKKWSQVMQWDQIGRIRTIWAIFILFLKMA
jgi:hypothetical protein